MGHVGEDFNTVLTPPGVYLPDTSFLPFSLKLSPLCIILSHALRLQETLQAASHSLEGDIKEVPSSSTVISVLKLSFCSHNLNLKGN